MIASLLCVSFAVSGQTELAGQGHPTAPAREWTRKSGEAPPRPGIGDFAADLAENSIGLFSRDNFLPFLLGAGAAAATHPVDVPVRDYFDRGDRFGVFEEGLGEQAGRLPVVMGTVAGLWTLSRFHRNDKLAQFSDDLAQASALAGVLTLGLKHGIGRQRPDGSNHLSFPSGHTSSAFAAAAVVDHHYGTTATIAAYAAASFVAASRLDASKHHLSDVVAGATLGYLVGRTVTRQKDRRVNGIAWVPILSPSSQTFGVALSWQFGPSTTSRRLRLQ